jgi:hypothetical protein
MLSIEILQQNDWQTLELLDLSGRILHSERILEQKDFGLEGFAPGMYFLRVGTEEGRTTQKIIIR